MDESASRIDKPIKLPKKAIKVRNKAPAAVQITAEQLLREAKERDLEILPPPPKQKISDPEELKEYQLKRRKEFEDKIRRNRGSVPNWIKYAKFEETQNESQRARSIFERALDVDHRNIPLWLQYAEFEIRNRQVNHARNIWDRAVSILPRANQFWLKYVYMEETLGNIPAVRQIFERWMEWEPGEQAWQTYINFEMRYKEIDRARIIWQRLLHIHSDVKNWIRYAQFEARNGNVTNARLVYERAVEFFGDDHLDETLLIAFAKFEEQQKEHDRVRVIYEYGLKVVPKERCTLLYQKYSEHEKKYGEKAVVDHVVVSKRRLVYESRLNENKYDYDTWYDYLRLLENEPGQASFDAIRDAYERAIASIPLHLEKSYWRRYIYIWICYAFFEELCCKDVDRTRQVYKACLQDFIPNRHFTFAKMWILNANFEIRQRNLTAARKILGTAIGMCPKNKLFRAYIEIELRLFEFDRCRRLYEKFLEFNSENSSTWVKFAEFETLLGEEERARAIYELGIKQSALDMPEVLWKAYIDFERSLGEIENARNLYKRLLQKTHHVKVWISYAKFEASIEEDDSRVQNTRQIYKLANKALKDTEIKDERVLLLETWLQFELENGNESSRSEVEREMPKRVKKRRKIQTDDGLETAGWEEYFDYIFPADEAAQANVKLLSMAKKWKEQVSASSLDQDNDESQEQAHAHQAQDERIL